MDNDLCKFLDEAFENDNINEALDVANKIENCCATFHNQYKHIYLEGCELTYLRAVFIIAMQSERLTGKERKDIQNLYLNIVNQIKQSETK